MTSRDIELDQFLLSNGWGNAQKFAITPDASKRRYTRLSNKNGTAILMDCPPEAAENTTSFVRVSDHLRGLGLGAPEIFAHDPVNGFVLTQDLGELRFADEFNTSPERQGQRYSAAIDVLAFLSRHPAPAWLPKMGAAQYVGFLDRLFDFYLLDLDSEQFRQDFTSKLIEMADPIFSKKPCLTMRDCHAENLIWVEHAQGMARVGLIDFQDATQSHPNYDVTSLIYDVRRDISQDLRDHLLQQFCQATDSHIDDFVYSCAGLILLRNLRILGGFARLARQDGKTHYLKWAPRAWEFVVAALRHPELAPLESMIKRHIPEPTTQYLQGLYPSVRA